MSTAADEQCPVMFPEAPIQGAPPVNVKGAVYPPLQDGSSIEVAGHAKYFSLPMMAAFELRTNVVHIPDVSTKDVRKHNVRFTGIAKCSHLWQQEAASAADTAPATSAKPYVPPTGTNLCDPARSLMVAGLSGDVVEVELISYLLRWRDVLHTGRAPHGHPIRRVLPEHRDDVTSWAMARAVPVPRRGYAFVEFPTSNARDAFVRYVGMGTLDGMGVLRRRCRVSELRQTVAGFVPNRLKEAR